VGHRGLSPAAAALVTEQGPRDAGQLVSNDDGVFGPASPRNRLVLLFWATGSGVVSGTHHVSALGGATSFVIPAGGTVLTHPVDRATGGYWLVASDGGIFAY
jgi:hypothetical protein